MPDAHEASSCSPLHRSPLCITARQIKYLRRGKKTQHQVERVGLWALKCHRLDPHQQLCALFDLCAKLNRSTYPGRLKKEMEKIILDTSKEIAAPSRRYNLTPVWNCIFLKPHYSGSLSAVTSDDNRCRFAPNTRADDWNRDTDFLKEWELAACNVSELLKESAVVRTDWETVTPHPEPAPLAKS